MADGMYIVELVLFDKAGNESQDTFTQTLDNTGPQIRFVSPAENAEATLYSTWMNESKHIIFDAKDETGVNKCYIYLQGKLDYFVSYNTMYLEKTITRPVTNKETGKLNYTGYVYDNAKTVDKTNNTYIADSPGNYTLFSREIWLDKTNPAITASHDDTIWYEAPYTVTASFYDYPSNAGVNDVSGVRDKQYAITEDDTRPTQWTDYTDGVTLTNGGVYYLHFKCVDFAGNETVTTEKIKINTPSQIIGTVRPTEDYKHTIYYSSPGFYVIKNTAYNTKYHFELKEPDVDDTIKAEIALISKDNASIYALSDTISYPTGEIERDIVFNVAYLDESDNQLPDGVYDMFITLTEGKEDEEEVKTHDKVFGCEVVIKRNAPPTPIINTDSGEVMIDYPEETLTGSLNSETIKAHYKKQYKTVKDGDGSSNTYKTYTGAFDAEDGIVTALYTDIAGNTSIATKRIFQDNGIGGSETDDILTDGNTTTVEESRAANTYYIGIRREKERGINTDVFDFMN